MCACALHLLLPPDWLDRGHPRSWLLVPHRDRLEHREASGHKQPESSSADRAQGPIPAHWQSPEPELFPADQRGPDGRLGMVLLSGGERLLRAIQFCKKPVQSASDRCGTDRGWGLSSSLPSPTSCPVGRGYCGEQTRGRPLQHPLPGLPCALSVSQTSPRSQMSTSQRSWSQDVRWQSSVCLTGTLRNVQPLLSPGWGTPSPPQGPDPSPPTFQCLLSLRDPRTIAPTSPAVCTSPGRA